MIFARFSTLGTFPRKLRGEFRAPFSAAGCSRFSALYLNARRISRAGGNALLKSAIFYPIFLHTLPRCLPFLAFAVWYASGWNFLAASSLNCFKATWRREKADASEWRDERKREGQQRGGDGKTFYTEEEKLTFFPLARPRKKEMSGSRSVLRILQTQVYTPELWPEKSEVRGQKVTAECLACDAHNKIVKMQLGETFVGTRKWNVEEEVPPACQIWFSERDGVGNPARAYLHSGKTMFLGPRGDSRKTSQTRTTLE